jgi:predicted AAA+ superfamily ATPase
VDDDPRPGRFVLTGYVDHLVTREAPALGVTRDPVRMRRYLQAIASNTAGTPAHKVLYDAAGISRLTATSYDDLLGRTLDTDVAAQLRAAGRTDR